MIRGGIGPRGPGAQHPGQRLAGVVTPAAQGVQAEPFEVRLCAFLVRVAGDHGRVQPQPGHAFQCLIRHRDAGDRAMTSLDARPRPPPGGVHRRRNPRQHPAAAAGDLIQRPPAGGHRGDRAEQAALIRHYPEVADHLGAVSDRARQVRQYPAPVVDQQPPAGQRLRQARCQPALISQRPQQRHPGVRHDARTVGSDFQAPQPAGSVHLASAPRSGPVRI